ncbi:hypothetical protein QFC19_004788 [Naganishia cerealis]|uniref:Uncharacterized protein n=1 Tax=Naganishia cerealis TaxID=610337 RepID=A0ACC2VSY9_9TREE|nr:hypothetical protein QFC19_004788 [Naganishia cerealis]
MSGSKPVITTYSSLQTVDAAHAPQAIVTNPVQEQSDVLVTVYDHMFKEYSPSKPEYMFDGDWNDWCNLELSVRSGALDDIDYSALGGAHLYIYPFLLQFSLAEDPAPSSGDDPAAAVSTFPLKQEVPPAASIQAALENTSYR